MLPVLLATIDGLARARRRREDVGRSAALDAADRAPVRRGRGGRPRAGDGRAARPAPPGRRPAGRPGRRCRACGTRRPGPDLRAGLRSGCGPWACAVFGAEGRPGGAGPAAAVAVAVAILLCRPHHRRVGAQPVRRRADGAAATCGCSRPRRRYACRGPSRSARSCSRSCRCWPSRCSTPTASACRWPRRRGWPCCCWRAAHVAPWAWLGASLLAGCAVAAVMIVLRRPPRAEAGPAGRDESAAVTYAGPGSLGGRSPRCVHDHHRSQPARPAPPEPQPSRAGGRRRAVRRSRACSSSPGLAAGGRRDRHRDLAGAARPPGRRRARSTASATTSTG